MRCLDENDLLAWPEDAARPELSGAMDDHLDACPSCRRLVTEWVRLEHAPEPDEVTRLPVLARGAVLGRYTILEGVGHGAAGVVYAAYDPTLDRKVALKLLRASQAAPEGRPRCSCEKRRRWRVSRTRTS